MPFQRFIALPYVAKAANAIIGMTTDTLPSGKRASKVTTSGPLTRTGAVLRQGLHRATADRDIIPVPSERLTPRTDH